MRRQHRVLEVPVLSVAASYPVLSGADGDIVTGVSASDIKADALPAPMPGARDIERFNQGCRSICEAFVAWAMGCAPAVGSTAASPSEGGLSGDSASVTDPIPGSPAAQAEAEFLAAGGEARRYRFLRRELVCHVNILLPTPEDLSALEPGKQRRGVTRHGTGATRQSDLQNQRIFILQVQASRGLRNRESTQLYEQQSLWVYPALVPWGKGKTF